MQSSCMTYHHKLQTALHLAKAVQHWHGMHMLHLNIKPQNVLVDIDGDVLLSDLGITCQMQTLSHSPSSAAKSMGTVSY